MAGDGREQWTSGSTLNLSCGTVNVHYVNAAAIEDLRELIL
jgi:hypothetical protein